MFVVLVTPSLFLSTPQPPTFFLSHTFAQMHTLKRTCRRKHVISRSFQKETAAFYFHPHEQLVSGGRLLFLGRSDTECPRNTRSDSWGQSPTLSHSAPLSGRTHFCRRNCPGAAKNEAAQHFVPASSFASVREVENISPLYRK